MKNVLNKIVDLLIEEEQNLMERQSEVFFRCGCPVKEKMPKLTEYEIKVLNDIRKDFNNIEDLIDYIQELYGRDDKIE